ncbi:unnamed protein product [Allacma fusca]|uniref:Uncharacterized protein n=1 Tax=Allacma fusca TaxID=39272 RepID=A0A8J2KUR3_9HEXA|nr:unnamed protein product [Allacma fusca]
MKLGRLVVELRNNDAVADSMRVLKSSGVLERWSATFERMHRIRVWNELQGVVVRESTGFQKRWSSVHEPTQVVLTDQEFLGMDDPRLVGLINVVQVMVAICIAVFITEHISGKLSDWNCKYW